MKTITIPTHEGTKEAKVRKLFSHRGEHWGIIIYEIPDRYFPDQPIKVESATHIESGQALPITFRYRETLKSKQEKIIKFIDSVDNERYQKTINQLNRINKL